MSWSWICRTWARVTTPSCGPPRSSCRPAPAPTCPSSSWTGRIHATHGFGADLTVVPMEGWRRAMEWEETGLPWVLPSPNMPTPDTARVYPGGCLIEGTNLSEGRGTTRPFELIGAPFLEGQALA